MSLHYVSLEEAKNLITKDKEWTESSSFKEAVEIQENVNKFYPCEIVVAVFRDNDGVSYDGWAGVKIKHTKLDLHITYSKYTRKYDFRINNVNRMKHVTSYALANVYQNIKSPNKIGILSTKKMEDWIKYYEEVLTDLEKIESDKEAAEKEFLKELEGLEISWNNEGKSGSILKNGIVFSFKIGPDFISKTIGIHYSVSSELSNFKLLYDNKFIKK